MGVSFYVVRCQCMNILYSRSLFSKVYPIGLDISFPPPSTGVGQTGTFIAVDAMMQRLKEKDDLDIYNFVTQMRTKRTFMVQDLVCRPTVYSWAI